MIKNQIDQSPPQDCAAIAAISSFFPLFLVMIINSYFTYLFSIDFILIIATTTYSIFVLERDGKLYRQRERREKREERRDTRKALK